MSQRQAHLIQANVKVKVAANHTRKLKCRVNCKSRPQLGEKHTHKRRSNAELTIEDNYLYVHLISQVFPLFNNHSN